MEITGERVQIERRDKVGVISFSSPKANSLSLSMLHQLRTAIETLSGDSSCSVLLLRSEGSDVFCAGASLAELSTLTTTEQAEAFFRGFADLLLAMRDCQKFIITRVQGKTVGGGVGIVAASDYSIASSQASFRLSELAIGFGPFVISPAVERRIGMGSFSDMTIDTSWRSAEWAVSRSLVSTVVSPLSLDTEVEALCERLAALPIVAMSRLKEVFWRGTDEWPDLLPARAKYSAALFLQGKPG